MACILWNTSMSLAQPFTPWTLQSEQASIKFSTFFFFFLKKKFSLSLSCWTQGIFSFTVYSIFDIGGFQFSCYACIHWKWAGMASKLFAMSHIMIMGPHFHVRSSVSTETVYVFRTEWGNRLIMSSVLIVKLKTFNWMKFGLEGDIIQQTVW